MVLSIDMHLRFNGDQTFSVTAREVESLDLNMHEEFFKVSSVRNEEGV
jgi:hypothetical protein